jgi:radical S-adenosyl methionine domain-containing protein 2
VLESNKVIRGSYLILDKYIRFLDKGDREEKVSKSILDVSIRKAIT